MSVEQAQNSFGLTRATLNKLDSVFQLHDDIELVLIYGSRAKGNYRVGSDIDLTIKGGILSFSEMMEIEDQVDDLYLPYMVDLSQYETLKNSDLIEHINRVSVVIYRKKRTKNRGAGSFVV